VSAQVITALLARADALEHQALAHERILDQADLAEAAAQQEYANRCRWLASEFRQVAYLAQSLPVPP
jgi:hypothetical protein